MSKSLRDQLVAAGLASASRAKKLEKQVAVESQTRKKRSKTDPNAKPQSSESRQQALKAKQQKAQRDREAAQATNSRRSERAIRAEIRQMLAQHNLRTTDTSDDDVPYNFLHNKKIKRIYLPKAQVDQLSKGTLVIINNDGIYCLVTKEIADKIATRDPRRIVASHGDKPKEEEMDEYYKQFEVPEDLDW